jgi:hypothetical protein
MLKIICPDLYRRTEMFCYLHAYFFQKLTQYNEGALMV